MKALLASTLTALVLVSAAWASNVTPAQLSALTKRVTKLEKVNASLGARLASDEAYSAKCFSTFQPVKLYDVTINNGTKTFTEWSPPDAGDSADFWAATTTDSSCFKPK